MDFELNVWEILLTAGLVWGVIQLQHLYRGWRRKSIISTITATETSIRTKAIFKNTVDAITCGKCGKKVKSYVEYDDGDQWCLACDSLEEE